MLLEAGGDEARFAPRLVTGVKLSGPAPTPEHLVLDGQQRLTSLFLALKGDGPVETFTEKKEPIPCHHCGVCVQFCPNKVIDMAEVAQGGK